MSKKELTWKQVKLSNVILSYPALFTPDEFGGQKNYKTDCLISKKDPQFKELMADIILILEEDLGLKWDDLKHKPIKDFDWEGADREDLKGYASIRTKSKADKKRPPVVDTQLLPIGDESEIYGGCVANVNVSVGCYDNKFGKGVTIILNAVQKVKDGEPMAGGGGSVENMFEVLEDNNEGGGESVEEEFQL